LAWIEPNSDNRRSLGCCVLEGSSVGAPLLIQINAEAHGIAREDHAPAWCGTKPGAEGSDAERRLVVGIDCA
jgi:hypothetical protein